MSHMNRISMLDEMLFSKQRATLEPGENKPGMILQRQYHDIWMNVLMDGKMVKSPVDIDALPAGKYRLKRAASD